MSEFLVRQESDRLASTRLGWIGLFSLAIGALGVLCAALLDSKPESVPRPRPTGSAFRPGTPERSLIESSERGIALRAKQRAALERYGWADRDAGLARIPIDRAIELSLDEAH